MEWLVSFMPEVRAVLLSAWLLLWYDLRHTFVLEEKAPFLVESEQSPTIDLPNFGKIFRNENTLEERCSKSIISPFFPYVCMCKWINLLLSCKMRENNRVLVKSWTLSWKYGGNSKEGNLGYVCYLIGSQNNPVSLERYNYPIFK